MPEAWSYPGNQLDPELESDDTEPDWEGECYKLSAQLRKMEEGYLFKETYDKMSQRYEEMSGRYEEMSGKYEEMRGRYEWLKSRYDEINGAYEQVYDDYDVAIPEWRASYDWTVALRNEIRRHPSVGWVPEPSKPIPHVHPPPGYRGCRKEWEEWEEEEGLLLNRPRPGGEVRRIEGQAARSEQKRPRRT